MGAIFGVIIAIRVVVWLSNSGSSGSSASTSAGRPKPTYFKHSAAVTLVLQTFLVVLLINALEDFASGQHSRWRSSGWLVVSALLLFPWWAVTRLAVPLGLYGHAYFLSRLARFVWRKDKPGGPLLAAAWVLARKQNPSEFSLNWVEERLQKATVLQASVVAAQGFLEAAKGNLPEARRLLESVYAFDSEGVTDTTLQLVASWLSSDAAACGEWERVYEFSQGRARAPLGRGAAFSKLANPLSPRLALMNAIARRQLGQQVLNDALWWYWLRAPKRLSTFSMVAQTAARPKFARAHVVRRKFTGASTPLDRALLIQSSLGDRDAQPLELVDLARLWEKTFADEALRTHLVARAQTNGGGDVDETLAELKALVEADLGPRMAAQLDAVRKLARPPQLLFDALAVRRDQLVDELELQVDRLERREKARDPLPAAEEWREVTRLIESYKTICAMGGADERGLAQSIVRDRMVNYGAWLYNERHQMPLAGVIFRFLEAEARAVGDTAAAELNRSNASLCI